MTVSITILPAAFLAAIEMLSLCTSIPIYLVLLIIKGRSFPEGLRQAPKPYSKRGALFILRLERREETISYRTGKARMASTAHREIHGCASRNSRRLPQG